MDNTLVYEAGDCGSIPYRGAKLRILTATFNFFWYKRKNVSCLKNLPGCVERLYVFFTRRAMLVRVQHQVPSLLGNSVMVYHTGL